MSDLMTYDFNCKKVFIIGYFGFGVVGDEAILQGTLSILSQLGVSKKNIIAASNDPIKTATQHNLNTCPINDLSQIIDSILDVDLVVLAGGGAFNEYEKWQSSKILTNIQDYNVMCAATPYLCKLANTPCFIFGVGVEPIYSKEAKNHIVTAFNLATYTSVRDQGSLRNLTKCGYSKELPEVNCCPAVLIKPQYRKWVKDIRNVCDLKNQKLISISLRHWNYKDLRNEVDLCDYEVWISQDLKKISAEFDCYFLFIPFDSSNNQGVLGDDIPIMKRIIAKAGLHKNSMIWAGELDPKQIAYAFSLSDLVIGCRFHSILLSMNSGTPCIALSYSEKVKNYMYDAQLSDFILDLDSNQRGNLYNLFVYLNEFPTQQKTKIKNFHELKIANARNYAHKITEVLNTDAKVEAEVKSEPFLEYIRHTAEIQKLHHVLQQDQANIITIVRELMSKGDWEKVIETLIIIMEMTEKNAELSYCYAFSMHQIGNDINSAINFYNLSLENGFDEFWVRYNRGHCFLLQGKKTKAVDDWRCAMKLPCDLFEPKNNIKEKLAELS